MGVIFAHLSLRQAVEAFGTLIDLYEQGRSLPEAAHNGVAEELSQQVRAC